MSEHRIEDLSIAGVISPLKERLSPIIEDWYPLIHEQVSKNIEDYYFGFTQIYTFQLIQDPSHIMIVNKHSQSVHISVMEALLNEVLLQYRKR